MFPQIFSPETIQAIKQLKELGSLMTKEAKKKGPKYLTTLFMFLQQMPETTQMIKAEIEGLKKANKSYLRRYSKLLSDAKTNQGSRRTHHPVPRYPANR